MLLALAAALSCGPNGMGQADSGLSLEEGLALSPDALSAVPADNRAALFEAAHSRSLAEAEAQVTDAPAVFAVERDGHLAAAELPLAHELANGASGGVDLDGSADPWPNDALEELGGLSERELADRVAGVLAAKVGLPGRPYVERDLEAPYAAAVVQGQVRLNPALVWLVAAAEGRTSAVTPRGLVQGSGTPAGQSSCSAGPGLFPALALAGLIALRRRAR